MGMGLALLGGALQGAGAGLAQVGQMNAIQRFEAYREARRREADEARIRLAGEINTGLETHKTNENIRQTKEELPYKTAAKVQEIGAETEGRMTLEQIKAQNDRSLEQLKSSLNMTETQARLVQEQVNALNLAKKQIGEAKVTADGALVFYSKTGERIGFTKAGGFVPPKGAEEDTVGEIDPTKRGARRGADAVEQPADTGQHRAMAADINRLAREYETATPESHPGLFRNGRKLPLEEAKQLIQQAYGR